MLASILVGILLAIPVGYAKYFEKKINHVPDLRVGLVTLVCWGAALGIIITKLFGG